MRFTEGIVEMDSIGSIEEAEAYIAFLQPERERHEKGMEEAQRRAAFHGALMEFYRSALDRHLEDIVSTTRRMNMVTEQWLKPSETTGEPVVE